MKHWQLLARPNRTTRSIVLLVLLSFALAVALISVQHMAGLPPAYTAGTINVTTTQDQYNTDPTKCSLREAVQSINTNTSFGGCTNPGGAADTIQLQALDYTLTITGAASVDNSKGSVDPLTSMIIRGSGMTQTVVKAAGDLDDCIVEVYSNAAPVSFAIQDMTVQDGPEGGVRIQFATSTADGSDAQLTGMVVQNNQGPGLWFEVASDQVTVNIEDVLIQGNRVEDAFSRGGGIAAGYAGNMSLENVTIYDNIAGYGGGIYVGGQYSDDQLQMTNVTIYSNTARTSGGGLHTNWGGSVTATNSTIAGNRATNQSGGNIYNDNGYVALANTIVSGGYTGTNTANNCGGNPTASVSSLGHNIDSGNSCGLAAAADQVNTDPDLAAGLANNGGTIPTLALLNSSSAIDAGDDSLCPAKDARGMTRPQGAQCDVGAYEFEAPTADPKAVSVTREGDVLVTLSGQSSGGGTLAYWIETLPDKGMLYQYQSGGQGAQITTVPTEVTDVGHRVIFVPGTAPQSNPYTGFDYYVRDGKSQSDPATVVISLVGRSYLPILMRPKE